MTRKQRNEQIGKGQRMISAAEFAFGFGDIDRAIFNSRVAEGNALIVNALDGIEGAATIAALYSNFSKSNNGLGVS